MGQLLALQSQIPATLLCSCPNDIPPVSASVLYSTSINGKVLSTYHPIVERQVDVYADVVDISFLIKLIYRSKTCDSTRIFNRWVEARYKTL